MNEFNGTNPLLDALGDEPTIRDLTINNNISFKIVEPLTGLQIQAETIVRVHGEVAFQQIQNNITQLNELKRQDVVTCTNMIVNEQITQWELTNCTISNGLLTYTGGFAIEEGKSSEAPLPSLFATKPFEVGEELQFTVNPNTAKQLCIAFDNGSKIGDFSDGSAAVKERSDIQRIQLFNGRSAPQGNIDTTTLSDGYLIVMTLQNDYQALLTIKDTSTEQELASLMVDASNFEIGPFTRIWIYAELESTASMFNLHYTVQNHINQS